MSNCIYENEFIIKGLSQTYGLSEYMCELVTTDIKKCNECLRISKNIQNKFFEK